MRFMDNKVEVQGKHLHTQRSAEIKKTEENKSEITCFSFVRYRSQSKHFSLSLTFSAWALRIAHSRFIYIFFWCGSNANQFSKQNGPMKKYVKLKFDLLAQTIFFPTDSIQPK